MNHQKVIMRCLDGRIVRGFIGNFTISDEVVALEDESAQSHTFKVDQLKAIFFVKTYIEGGVPWEKGFFLEPQKGPGFFLIPVDHNSNNIKVFVVASSVWDVTVMG